MYSLNHYKRENEPFELVVVKEEEECPILSCSHSIIDDEHIGHVVVKEEKEPHQVTSVDSPKLKIHQFEQVIVKNEKQDGYKNLLHSEPSHQNIDPKCEEDVEVSFGVKVYVCGIRANLFNYGVWLVFLPNTMSYIQ